MKTSLSPEAFLSRIARDSWDLFKRDALLMVLASFIVAACGTLTLGILLGPLTVGFILVIRRRRQGDDASFGDVFNFDHFVSSFFAFVLISLAVGVGLMLLVIPGLIVGVLCLFTFHAIAYRKQTAVDAIRSSVALVRENFVHVLGLLIVLSLLNAVASALVLASLVTAPLSMIATTVAYEMLTEAATLPADASARAHSHPVG